jgi:GNAT superfamily N-acetyltransferase
MTVKATAPSDPTAAPRSRTSVPAWSVRLATPADVEPVVDAVAQLLLELGGTPPDRDAMHTATRALLDDRDAGVVLVAEGHTGLVGLLAASLQTAIHIPGRYALIQDLWVHPSLRSNHVGAALIAALVELARQTGIARLEVGLPRDGFAAIDATTAFYARNGFQTHGPRMRRVLA